MAYTGSPSYPSNPPSLPAEANYPANAPIATRGVGVTSTTVGGTGGPPSSPNYYGAMQAAAASGNAANFGAGPAAAAAPAPPAPVAAAPAAPAVTDEMISAGAVPWSALPNSRQMVLANVFGAAAPTVYEEARSGSGRGGVPPQRGFFDPSPGGTDMGSSLASAAGNIGRLGLGGALSAGLGLGGGASETNSPAAEEHPPGSVIAKNTFDTNLGAVRGNIAAATAPGPTFTPGGASVGDQGTVFTPYMPPTNVSRTGMGDRPAPPVGSDVSRETPPVGSDVPLPPTPPYGPLEAGEGTQPKTVTVGPGDTLSSIAEKALGDPARAWQIARANGINANRIQPGQTLILPASAADTPNPRPRPSGPPGQRADNSYYGGLNGGEGPPFTGGAGAQASPGQPDMQLASHRGQFTPGYRMTPDQWPLSGAAKASGATVPDLNRIPSPPELLLPNEDYTPSHDEFIGGSRARGEMAAMPSRATETGPAEPDQFARWEDEYQKYDQREMNLGLQPNRPDPSRNAYPEKYYDRNYRGVETLNPNNRYMEDIVPGYKESEYDVSALSANDNGPKGVSMIPGSRLPPAMQPNVMPDYFRGMKPLPVSKPANQARVGSNLLGGERKDRLLADYWRMANPEMPGSMTNRDRDAIGQSNALIAGYHIDEVFGQPKGFPRYGSDLEPNLTVRGGKVYGGSGNNLLGGGERGDTLEQRNGVGLPSTNPLQDFQRGYDRGPAKYRGMADFKSRAPARTPYEDHREDPYIWTPETDWRAGGWRFPRQDLPHANYPMNMPQRFR